MKTLDRRKCRRVDPLDFGAHFLNRPLANLLAGHLSRRRDTEQHVPAALVEHGAHGLGRLAACTRRVLELQRLGFSCRGQRCDLFRRHERASFLRRPHRTEVRE